MVKNTKNNQHYWLENLKKAISYVNSEEFLNDLESGKYDTDRNSIIYLNLEDGTVSTTPVFGATLKTVKLSFWNVQKLGKNNFSIQNGIDVTLERFNKFVSDFISELTPTLKSKPHRSIARGEYPFCIFDKIHQKKSWNSILVELFNQDFDYFGFDDIFDRKEFSFKKSLSKDVCDLFFESFYCDDHRELTSRMFLYKQYNEISEYLNRFVCENHIGSEYFLRDMFLKYPNILMEIILKDSKDIFKNNLNKFINSETCKISLLRHGGNLPVYVDLKEDDYTKYRCL